MQMLDFNYKNLSTDYNLLFELIKTQRIICFVTYNHKLSDDKTITMTDICSSSRVNTENAINIGTRGISFISAMSGFNNQTIKEDFVEQCVFYDLKFLIP